MAEKEESSREATARELMFVSGYVHRLLRNEARKLNLRWTALMVLKNLQLLGPGSQRTLAAIEQVSAPTMSILLQQMEEEGWITRETGEHDARFSRVSMTAAGRGALKSAGRRLRLRLEEEVGELPPEVLDGLQKNLGLLSTHVMGKIQRPKANEAGAED